MARVAGVDIPDHLRLEYALQSIYGIGKANVFSLLNEADLDPDMRAKDLNDEHIAKIQKALDTFMVQGDLRRHVNQNITRLKEIGAYRGLRHRDNLPTRGQRTKTNARTLRGKRKTVGAFKKSDMN